MNEPFPYSDAELEILREYYRDGYETVRTVDGDVPVVLSNAFQKVASWGSFMPSDRYDAVALDVVSCLRRVFGDRINLPMQRFLVSAYIFYVSRAMMRCIHSAHLWLIMLGLPSNSLSKAIRTTFGRSAVGFQSCRSPIGIYGRLLASLRLLQLTVSLETGNDQCARKGESSDDVQALRI